VFFVRPVGACVGAHRDARLTCALCAAFTPDDATEKQRELSERIEDMDFAVDKWQQQEIAWSSKLRHHAHSLSQLRRHMVDSERRRDGAQGTRSAGPLKVHRRSFDDESPGGCTGPRVRGRSVGQTPVHAAGAAADLGGAVRGRRGGAPQLVYDSDDLICDLELQALSLPGGGGGGGGSARAMAAVGRSGMAGNADPAKTDGRSREEGGEQERGRVRDAVWRPSVRQQSPDISLATNLPC
jgi:hypothetical protein